MIACAVLCCAITCCTVFCCAVLCCVLLYYAMIGTLKESAPDRRCYRMAGGVLVERTEGEVLPTLVTNKDQMTQFVENMSKQLEAKGREINVYREENNIRIRGEEDTKPEASVSDSKSGGGVSVANNS
ncbi:hypothetical protein ACOMHN_028980 [Nucella lapillus]